MNEVTGSNNFNNFCTFQNIEKRRTKIATKEHMQASLHPLCAVAMQQLPSYKELWLFCLLTFRHSSRYSTFRSKTI